ncbi:hypothetical protein P4O66_006747 [Electrophorus voltai]|uniref:Cadherin domain-containing protein n=1 Tax=Electrophorus voltai TaxID=2609070 RepID=A0AAD8ZG41_9TELE|nr:hypothetical protein P4O66_006747 [Electrophorus voltai]
MERKYKRKSVNTVFSCMLAFLLHKLCLSEKICSVPSEPVTIKENNTIDTVVVRIDTKTKDVTLTLTENPEGAFGLRGFDLILKKRLDFETMLNPEELTVHIRCNKTGFRSIALTVRVHIENINDNPPSFSQSEYSLDVNELTPVNTSVGLIEAKDADSGVLYYTMEPSVVGCQSLLTLPYSHPNASTFHLSLPSLQNAHFRLESMHKPSILVNKFLDYDVIQHFSFTLFVQDTPPPSLPGQLSYTATATITVHIKDIDNRPPWFQPCMRTTLGTAKICLSVGYKGKVNLTERQASQVANRDQFASTSVNIEVMKKSRNPPKFERERYDAFVYSNNGPENMVLRDKTSNRPFRVRARDDDFANPGQKGEIDFACSQLRAVDVSTGESGTATLSVLVLPPVGVQSPSEGYRAGDMALLGFVMAALLVLCLIVIGYLISRLKKANPDTLKLSECLGPCLPLTEVNRPRPRDGMQFTNDGFMNEGSNGGRPRARRAEKRDRKLEAVGRVRVTPRDRPRHCSSCGMRTHSNHSHHGSPSGRNKARGTKDQVKSILAKGRRQDRPKTVWFKESEDSSDIEVEIIPDDIGLRHDEELEEGEEDSSSAVQKANEAESGDRTVMDIQDLDSQEGTASDHREPLCPGKMAQ